MNDLEKLITKLERIGISIELVGNFPWIYLDKINGERIVERTADAKHGFNIAYKPIHVGQKLKLVNQKEMFQLIKRYVNAKG